MGTLITMVDKMGFTKFNNAEHTNYHTSVYDIIKDATEALLPQAMKTEYQAAIATEQLVVKRQLGSAISPEIEEADKKRDELLHYIFALIDTASISPIEAQKHAAAQLLPKVNPYRGIARDALGEENAEVTGLCDSLTGDPNLQTITHLPDTVVALKAANEHVKALMAQRNAETPPAAETEAKRLETDRCYEIAMQRICAMAVIDTDSGATALIGEINNLINRTNTVYKIRIGRNGGDDTDGSTPTTDPDPPVDPPIVDPDLPADPPTVDPDLPA